MRPEEKLPVFPSRTPGTNADAEAARPATAVAILKSIAMRGKRAIVEPDDGALIVMHGASYLLYGGI